MRLAAALALFSTALAAQPAATYEVTFEATWSAATFPEGFPANPHFSPLVGAVHGPGATLWTAGEAASPGIERMAEVGATATLLAEVETLAQAGRPVRALSGSGLPLSPGTVGLQLDLDADAPLVSLVTMLAPSPDWFVGVSGLDLRDVDGWEAERVVDLFVYDAGSDDGATYTAADADADPKQPIARVEAAPFLVGGSPAPVGRFTFRRVTEAGTGDGLTAGVEVGWVSPNPVAQTARLRLRVAGGTLATVRVADALGRTVYTASGPVTAGASEVEIATVGWAPGLYVVRIEAEGVAVSRTFVVTR